MTTSYPPTTAAEIARLIDSDPIVASQIKEYLSSERLIELLDIELPEPPVQPEPNIDDFNDREIVSAAIHRGLESDIMEDMDSLDIIDELVVRGTSFEMIQKRLKK